MEDKNGYDELQLLNKVVEGDHEAYAIIYKYYLPKLYKYIFVLTERSKEDAEDLIQEVFVKIWNRRSTLITIHSFENYLFRMARNAAINWHERRSVHHQAIKQSSYLSYGAQSKPEQDMLYVEYHKIALEAIKKMPPKRQLIFNLSTQEGLSIDEIATIVHLSRSGVKKQLYTATRFIKEYLRKYSAWLPTLFMVWQNKFF